MTKSPHAAPQQADEAGPPPLFGHWIVEPWQEAVDTSALICFLVDRIKRHVMLSDDEALTIALWIMFLGCTARLRCIRRSCW